MSRIFSLAWNPKEVDSNASEGMVVTAKQKHASKELKLHSFIFLYRLTAEDMVQGRSGLKSWIKGLSSHPKIWIMGMSSHLKDSDYKWIFSPQIKQKFPHRRALHLRVLVNSRCSQVDNKT